MNRRAILTSVCMLATSTVLGVAMPAHAQMFSARDTVIGSMTTDKEKADRAGRLIAARAHDTLVAAKEPGGFRVQTMRLSERPREISPLSARIVETARSTAERYGWSYSGAKWIMQGSLSRSGDDAILQLRLVRDLDGSVLPMHSILLVGMGPRSWMGPISSFKPW